MAKETNIKKPKREPSITELIKRTDKEHPRPEDLALIRRRLDEDSSLVRINEFGEQAILNVTETYTKSALNRELYKRQVADKRQEMGYASASLIERMLINQVILCQIRMTSVETYHAEKVRESHSLPTGLYWDRLLTSYQRRFQRACESLAKVRKLLAEADSYEQRANNARTSATKKSIDIYKAMADEP